MQYRGPPLFGRRRERKRGRDRGRRDRRRKERCSFSRRRRRRLRRIGAYLPSAQPPCFPIPREKVLFSPLHCSLSRLPSSVRLSIIILPVKIFLRPDRGSTQSTSSSFFSRSLIVPRQFTKWDGAASRATKQRMPKPTRTREPRAAAGSRLAVSRVGAILQLRLHWSGVPKKQAWGKEVA